MKTILHVVAAALIAMGASGCGSGESQGTTDKKSKEPVVPVEVAEVTTGDISAYFNGTATVEAEQETEVVARVSGVVEEILVEEGDYVTAGEVLARLDDEKVSVQLERERAELLKQENNFNRNRNLHEKNLVSTEEFQQVKFEYERQKAAFELAQLELRYTEIRTPISGVVAERLIKVGNMILGNQAVFRVTGLDPLIAVLHVPEVHLESLKKGQKALLEVDALGEALFEGSVARISPVVDAATGTVKITVEVHDPTGRLRPGMFARVKIVYNVHRNTVMASKDAIISEDRESNVFVVRDSTVYRTAVVVGYENTSHVEILEGLQPGDTIVTTGKGSLKDSTKVQIVRRER